MLELAKRYLSVIPLCAAAIAVAGCQRHGALTSDGLRHSEPPPDVGIRLTYRVRHGTPTSNDLEKLVEVVRWEFIASLSNRAGAEPKDPPVASVFSDKSGQIVIDLSGVTNLEAAKKIVRPAPPIKFYWAKTIRTPNRNWQPYEPIYGKGDHPSISFTDVISHDTIRSPNLQHPDSLNDQRYAQVIKGWDLILSGPDIDSAQPEVGGTGGSGYIPELDFTPAGAKKMSAWCRAHQNEQAQLAVVLDGTVLSVAGLRDNEILSDNCVIEGSYTAQYVQSLCTLINNGSVSVDLVLVSAQKFPSN